MDVLRQISIVGVQWEAFKGPTSIFIGFGHVVEGKSTLCHLWLAPDWPRTPQNPSLRDQSSSLRDESQLLG